MKQVTSEMVVERVRKILSTAKGHQKVVAAFVSNAE
jgi:hypothetical protein